MRKFRGTMAERIRASYERLSIERPEIVRKVAAVKPCALCAEPAWSDALCMEHLIERGRAITVARQRERRLARRREFFLAKRSARHAGDLELWSELGWRQRKGIEMPTDVSTTAKWRKKWTKLAVVLPVEVCTTSTSGPTASTASSTSVKAKDGETSST